MDDPNPSVGIYLERVTPEKRQRDAERLLELMTRATGETSRLWGSVIGFGQYHYKYASGREGDAPAAGFAPRKSATVIYLLRPEEVGWSLIGGFRGLRPLGRVSRQGCPWSPFRRSGPRSW
jgi:hypothetical protein